jgi:hypothetical protein
MYDAAIAGRSDGSRLIVERGAVDAETDPK